jgi:hypothetical protein
LNRLRDPAPPLDSAEHKPYRLRLPGFLLEEEIGLGDAIKQITRGIGIQKPCGGCEKRATVLNNWVRFTR